MVEFFPLTKKIRGKITDAQLDQDETLFINHEDCGDRRRRLGITRKTNGYVYGCFNCSGGGFISLDSMGDIQTKRQDKLHNAIPTRQLPTDIDTNSGNWSANARSWVFRYGITQHDLDQFGVGYSKQRNAVILPVNSETWVQRNFDENLPKYFTFGVGKAVWASPLHATSKNLVLCEDILSGIKLSHMVSSIALLSSNINERCINLVCSSSSFLSGCIYIHLDNDNSQVRKNARTIRERLLLHTDLPVYVVPLQKDPKELSHDQIKEMYQ